MAILGFLGLAVALAGALLLTLIAAPALFGRSIDPSRLRIPVLMMLTGTLFAMGILVAALVTDDFSLEYVANHHRSTTPLPFTISTAWAALEGSIVLWGLVLAGFVFAVFRRVARRSTDPLGVAALSVMGFVAVFFFGLMVTVANPFEVCTEAGIGSCVTSSPIPWALSDAPLEGRGPNPLLQNHYLMAIHPPVLYVGYVGMTVPFAFGIASLALARSGADWLRRTRSWTLLAWAFLTTGIVLGGWWSYEVLGWGGYWAWDPVENASFLPWLMATALIHSSIVQARRGMLAAWNVMLAIATFSLTIVGTFLTRSGTIMSVHSFTQSAIGPVLLGFLAVVLIGSLTLFAFRAHLVASTPRLDSFASREGLFLLNNLILSVFAFIVLTGTLFPLFVEAFSGDRVSVGRPFFDRLAIPLAFSLLLLMGIGPVTPYRAARPEVVWKRIRGPLRFALAVGAGVVLVGMRDPYSVAVLIVGVFIISVIVALLITRTRTRVQKAGLGLGDALTRTLAADRGFWAGQLAHVGVAILAMGIAFSANLATGDIIDLSRGETTAIAGFELTYESGFLRQEDNRSVLGANVSVTRESDLLTVLEPSINEYSGQAQAITTPAVMRRWNGDLYLSLRSIDSEHIVMEATWFPLIWMVWLGGITAALGGLLAWLNHRKAPVRRPRESVIV